MLLISLVATAVLGVLGVVWGWLAGSHAILFDGAYTGLGLLLSALSLHASRIVTAGPTRNYPFGREALAPLGLMSQGLFLRRQAGYSDLVKAEAAQWLAGLGLSAGMLVAFGAAAVLEGTELAWLTAYVDPAVVIVAGLVLFAIPLAMVRETVRELLEGSPPASVEGPVQAIVDAVSAEHGLDAPTVRMSKLGAKLYLEVDYLVEAGRYDTAFADRVRQALKAALEGQPLDVWLNVDLSTDATWQH